MTNSNKQGKSKLKPVLLVLIIILTLTLLPTMALAADGGLWDWLLGLFLGTQSGSRADVTILDFTSSGANNFTSENLTVSYLVSDEDADPIKNITNWYRNGSSITVLNMPFEIWTANASNNASDYTKDYSGYENNGTVYGAIWNATGGFDGNGSYYFDGDDDYIDTNLDMDIDLQDKFSVSVWLKHSEVDTTENWALGATADSIFQLAKVSNGDLKFEVAGNPWTNSPIYTSGANVSDGDWHHVVAAWNSTETSIYYDGVLNVSATNTDQLGNVDYLRIGADNALSKHWNGSIDELVIYNYPLSPQQIKAIYENRTDLISFNETAVGDNWSVCITAHDGTSDGLEVCSGNLTVLEATNQSPSINSLDITSSATNNFTSENISITITATDVDNDPIKNITNWYLNTTSITITNTPFENWGSNSTHNASDLAKDYSGNENNATITGAIWDPDKGYDGKGAYVFDGDDYINFYDTATLDSINNSLTVSLWVNMTIPGDQAAIHSKGGGWNREGWLLTVRSNGNVRWHLGTGGSEVYTDNGNIQADTWYHIVAMLKDNELLTYINGVEQASVGTWSAGYVYPNNYDLLIGQSNGQFYLDGIVDDVMVLNHSLSEEQVVALYNNRTDLITSQQTRGGDAWQACTTPNDGTQDGTEVCSDTLTVIGPGLENTTINSSSLTNATDENITINYDLTNGSTNAVINWHHNGTSITNLNLPFDTSTDPTKDYSSFGNDATVTNAIWNATGGYDGNSAYYFDGSGDSLTITDNSYLDFGTEISIEVWMNPFNIPAGASLVRKGAGINGVYYLLMISNYVRLGINDVGWDSGGYLLPSNNTWYHVVGTFDGSNRRVYVNGVLESTIAQTATITKNALDLTIGQNGAGGEYFTGMMDEVRIYNRSLTLEQIQALYENRTDLISFNETSIGDNWSACITPNDGSEDGIEICSGNLTVLAANNIPNTAEVILNATDSSNYTTANITCWVNITDVDADQVYANFTWYLNGAINTSDQFGPFTQNTFNNIANISSTNTTKTENWTCEVQAWDAEDYETDSTNVSITIQNTPPTIDSTSITSSASNNFTTENISLTIINSDDDEDLIKNITNWYLNGTSTTVINMPFENWGENDTHNASDLVKDYSGYENNGTVSQAIWNSTGGYDGKGAFWFDGTNDYIDMNSYFPSLTNNFSISFWVNPAPSQVQYADIFGHHDNNNGFVMQQDNNNVNSFAFYVGTGAGYDTTGNVQLAADTWQFITLVKNSTHCVFYVNETNKAIGTCDSPLSVSSVRNYWLGQGLSDDQNVRYFTGFIDEFVIYNRSLSSEQIRILYENRTGLIDVAETVVGDNWSACITPNDGTEDGAEVCSVNLTVLAANNAPNTAEVILNTSSTNNYTTANITCWANITDADADQVYANFTWYLNGTRNTTDQSGPFTQNVFNNIANISSTNTSRGENWTCSVNANDATQYEIDSTNSSVLIQNTQPTIDSTAIDSSAGTNYTNENITLTITTSDDDSDIIKNITNWYLNGTSITVINMPFENWGSNSTHNASDIAKDYAGNDNNGSVSGAIWNSTGGYDGRGGFYLDGDDHITLPTTNLPYGSDERTMCIWAKTDTIGGSWSWAVAYGNTDGGGAYFIGRNADTLYVGGFADDVSVASYWAVDEWKHICSVYNGTEVFIYSNGQHITQAPKSWSTVENVAYIGRQTNAGEYWTGYVDEVLIFDYAFSANQIEALYQNQSDTMVVSNLNSVGTNWSACVTPNDGTEDGVEVCSGNLTVLALPNNIPNTAQVIINASSINNYSTDNITCWANITDDDADQVYANFTWYLNGTINTSDQSGPFTQNIFNNIANISSTNTTKTENWTCSVNANDATDYETDSTNVSITIQNTQPTIDSTTISSSAGNNYTTENITLTITNSDDDGDTIKNITNWYLDGTSITVLNLPFENWGSNSTHNVSNYTTDYSSYNTNGIVAGAEWNSNTGHDGKGAYEFNDDYINVTLPELNNFTMVFWFNYTALETVYNTIFGRQNTGLWVLVSGGDIQFSDTGGAGNSTHCSHNMASPGINIGGLENQWLHIAISRPTSGDNITYYLNGVEVDSCMPHFTGAYGPDTVYQLGRNGVGGGDYINGTLDEFVIYNRVLSASQIFALYENKTDIITSAETVIGDNWSSCIIPNDATEDGSEVCSINLTVLAPPNTAPNTAQVIINASSINNYSTDNITCWANITDVDADQIYANFTWYLNGTVNTSDQSGPFTQNTLNNIANISSINTSKQDIWNCSVNANDGTDYETDSTTINISILNSLPNTAQVIINTSSINNRSTDNITCWANFTDINSDDIYANFTWYLNGTINTTDLSGPFTQNTMNNVANISSSNTSAGDVWNCTVNAYDGEDYESDFTSVNISINSATMGISPNSSNFDGITTNFNSEFNLFEVDQPIIENTTYGFIKWNSNNINVSEANFDANIKFATGSVFVNSSSLNLVLNSSANITLYDLPYVYVPVVYEDGNFCSDCTKLVYIDDNLTFNVSHFTNYSVGANSNLIIWDQSDAGMPYGSVSANLGDQIYFYTNYSNTSSGTAITDADCNISFSDLNISMAYNATKALFEFNRSFSVAGAKTFNISCNRTNFETLSLTDTVLIDDSGCYIENSALTNVTLVNNLSYRNPCRIINSTLIDVALTSSRVYNSYVDPTTLVDSLISNSTVENSTVEYSSVQDSTFCGNFTVFGATIDNDYLISGRINYLNNAYYGPITLAAICSESPGVAVGVLSLNQSIVKNNTHVGITYTGAGLGFIVNLNASPLVNSTLRLSDSNYDAIYTNTTVVNYSGEGNFELNATVNDTLGNIVYSFTNVTIDNTAPNGSITIFGDAGNSTITNSQIVYLALNYTDINGIDSCRFANDVESNLNTAYWESCATPKAWMLSAGVGEKTVYFQVKDIAGNINTSNDTINYSASSSGAPTIPVVYDSVTGTDIDWWNSNNSIGAYWYNSTGSGTVQYRYRILDNGSCFENNCNWTDMGTAHEITVSNISLEEGHNYSFEVQAYNGVSTSSRTSNGSITDFTNPETPYVNSSTHSDVNVVYNNGTLFLNWTASDIGINASGIEGYSFLLNTLPGTTPDLNLESRYWNTLITSKNNGYGQVLNYNYTNTAYSVYSQIKNNLTQNDSVRVKIQLAEEVSDFDDEMGLLVYIIEMAEGSAVGDFAYIMTPSTISNIINVSKDIRYADSLTSATTYSFDLTINTTVNDETADIYVVVAGRSRDEDNRNNLTLAGSNAPADIDNTTSLFVCDDLNTCTDNSSSAEYAIQVEVQDSGDEWFTRYDNLQDGTYYFHVKAKDYADNWGDPRHYQLNIDTAGIGMYINSPYNGQLFSANPIPVNIEVNEPGWVYVSTQHPDGSEDNTSRVYVNTTYSFEVNLEDGTNEIFAVGNDSNGIISNSASVYALYSLYTAPDTNKSLQITYSGGGMGSCASHIRCDETNANYVVGVATENDGATFASNSITADTRDISSKIFMTTSDWSSSGVEDDLDDDDFLDRDQPSFGYQKGAGYYVVGAELRFADVWFDGSRSLNPGKYLFIFRYEGLTTDNKANISVSIS